MLEKQGGRVVPPGISNAAATPPATTTPMPAQNHQRV
jgi:hypothetical protein